MRISISIRAGSSSVSGRTRIRKPRREGVVLLMVIAMLALFATVGLSFVYYSESVALTARYARISATSELRDIAPDPDPVADPWSQIVYCTT